MSTRKSFGLNGWLLFAGGLAMLGIAKVQAQDMPPPPPQPAGPNMAADPAESNDPNVQVMTRGPVHEAYAMPVPPRSRRPG